MAQRCIKLALATAISLVFVACSPTPQPFDKFASQQPRPLPEGSLLPPPAHQGAAPAATATVGAVQQRVKVGLLLPLTGESGQIGTALRDAAVMALFDKYATLQHASNIKVELITQDTAGTPEGTKRAATAAVQQGATLLLGPLFSRNVEAIKPLAATGKVTIISFSNNKDIAGNGVYAYGFNPKEQAERIAKYAYQRGLNRIAALAPNDVYGREVIGSFKRISGLMGQQLKPEIRYTKAGPELRADVRELVQQGTNGARFTFDGLFLPEGGPRLGTILSSLSNMNVSPRSVRFLSTGLWDSPQLLANHALSGAWIASAPPRFYEGFVTRFENNYGYTPPRLASLSYDAVALAATMAMSPQGFSRRALMNPNGYSAPANGIFRFNTDGTTERKLAILEVSGQQLTEIDPAPTSFRQ